MASGTIYGSTGDSNWTFSIDWSESGGSDRNNQSKVKAKVYIGRASTQSYLGGNYSLTITINGSRQTFSGNIPYPTYINGGAWLFLKEKEVTVTHDSNGSKTCEISASMSSSDFWPNSCSASGDATLTALDRSEPTITQAAITNIDVTSFTIAATSNVNCDSWDYSLNGGTSWINFSTTNGTSASTTVTGLNLNTTYNVYIRARKNSNYVYGISGKRSAKTLGYSEIQALSDAYIGSTVNVSWKPLDADFKFKITLSCGEWSYTTSSFITPNQTSAYTYAISIPISVCDELPNSATGTLTAVLTTYTADETQIGSSAAKTSVLTVPFNIVPTITSVTLEEGTASGFNLYVVSLSTIKATVVAAGDHGSTIAGIMVKFGDNSVEANSSGIAVSDILQTAGSMTIETTVTDTRGRTATDTKTVTVYDYFKPTLAIDITVNGTTVTTTVTGSIAPVNNTNAKSLVVTRKRLSDDSTTQHTVNPLSSYTFTDTWTQTIADISVESYEYTAVVTDTKQSVTVARMTAVICISRLAGGRGVTFFGEASKEGFWIHDIQLDILASEYLEIARLLAKPYDSTADYFVGQFTVHDDSNHNSKIWECNTAITGGETWTSGHWTEVGAA